MANDKQEMVRPMTQKASNLETIDTHRALDWLNDRWSQSKNCPICDSSKWEVGSQLVEVKVFTRKDFLPGTPVRALVIVTCSNCGYTILFDAVAAGIVSNEE